MKNTNIRTIVFLGIVFCLAGIATAMYALGGLSIFDKMAPGETVTLTGRAEDTTGRERIDYSFDVPGYAYAEQDQNSPALTRIYFNRGPIGDVTVIYNGDTNFTPETYASTTLGTDYFQGTVLKGEYTWLKVDSDNSTYRIASLQDGKWLAVVRIVIKGIKYGGITESILNTFTVK